MQLIEKTDYSDKINFMPLGDWHVGSKDCDFDLLCKYIDWAKKNNAYVFLMGDLIDCATRESKTPPWNQLMNFNEAKAHVIRLLDGLNVIGAISGNHEQRLYNYAGMDIVEDICREMNIPFCGFSGVIRFHVGKRLNTSKARGTYKTFKETYEVYCHHSTGGGNSVGSKINRAEKLNEIYEGADIYCAAHSHILTESTVTKFCTVVSSNGKAKLCSTDIRYVNTGSFVRWDGSYAEQKQMSPNKPGAINIILYGTEHKIEIPT